METRSLSDRLDELEDRLSCLAARIAAAECEFLVMLAEFDARQGWGASGMRSSAHWLSWRTGLRLGVARERVRVARALTRLPLIREAFAAGQLSYCKVRALSRVATPPLERDLLEVALGTTGGQLERIVRSWRRTLIGEEAASRHLRRGWRRREEPDGSVVYTLRVAPEDAAIVDAAVAAGRSVVLDESGRPVETPEESQLAEIVTGEPPISRADADVVVLLAESFLTSSPAGEASDRTLVMVHADLDALATEAPPVAAPPEGDPMVDGMSAVQRSQAMRPPSCSTADGTPLSRSTVLRLLCTSPTQLMVHARDGRPLDLGRTQRHASRRQRRALATRDGGCRFPGCTQCHRLVPHHVQWWSQGGPTDIDLLVLLCPTHHRAVHEVGYRVDALGEGRFRFFRPDGRPLPGSGRLVPVNLDSAGSVSAATEPMITPTTIQPTWGGERLDLGLLIGGLADGVMVRSGVRLMDVPVSELDGTLRAAAQWPPDRSRAA